MNFFATTAKGLELLLVEELRELGAESAREKLAGVVFTGDLKLAYKACLWSRLANRILFPIAEFQAATPEALYQHIQTIAWDEHLNPTDTLHIQFVSSQSAITHSLYGAQKVKDAIVDQFREKYAVRPTVAREKPDVAIHVYLYRDLATVSIDLSGESLHKRGYRLDQGEAPLKETLAVAMLLRAKWKTIAAEGGMLLDPMCGSGTLLIEGALLATNTAPGLLRDYFGLLGWKKHDSRLWQLLKEEALLAKKSHCPDIRGYDIHPSAIKAAFANIDRAGFRGKIHVEKCDMVLLQPPKTPNGLLIVNPPYGERLGELETLKKLYADLGKLLKMHFLNWQAALLTGNSDLGKVMGLRSYHQYVLFNGPIPCQLLLFDIKPAYFIDNSPAKINEKRIREAQRLMTLEDREIIQPFINRLQKTLKHLRRQRQNKTKPCFRIYDADLPQYAVIIDLYEEKVVVKVYPAPKAIAEKAMRRLQQMIAVLPEVLQMPPAVIFVEETFLL